MSSTSESARAAAKSKVERLMKSDPHARVDASGYSPDGPMDAGVQTGPRPISRRQFRRGGSVEGSKGVLRADRKPRASGGRTSVDGGLINEDIKQERGGNSHIGGMKRGGRAGKLGGGPLMQNTGSPSMPPTTIGRKEGGRTGKTTGGELSRPPTTAESVRSAPPVHMRPQTRPEMRPQMRPQMRPGMSRATGGKVHVAGCGCSKCGGGRVERKEGGAIYGGTRPVAGRLARKGGGRTKGKTNVNIIITQPGGNAGPPMPPPGAMPPPGGPVGLHQGAPPPAVMGPPAGGPPPMMRKSGGRTNYPIDSGAGGGLGRLEKAKAYG